MKCPECSADTRLCQCAAAERNARSSAARKRKSKPEPLRIIFITMLQANRDRLREAIKMRDMPLVGLITGPTLVTAYVETRRTATQVEDELRAQLMFGGWMQVEEEEQE